MNNFAIPARSAVIALAAILAAVGLTTVAVVLATAQRGGAVVVLVGLSDSVSANRAAIDGCTRQAIKHAIDSGADLTIMPVGRTPADLRAEPIRTRLSLTDRLTARKARERRAAASRAADRRVAELLRRGAPEGASDTIAAAAIAATAFDSVPRDEPRTLVICDDGHQVSELVDVYRERLTDRRAAAIVRDMPTTNLAGVDVVFGAADTDAKAKLSTDREREITRFWTAHWARAVRARTVTHGVIPRLPSR